ncbi:HAD-IIB family hydrolase [Halomonas chromatireducens]|uniref:Putative mannosyl-3-phosphoglycerate phosphatase n=1 Tax=Halomonas chromatireducens TaxID=507626 RepID=A0A0X8HC73_9GAMM|nr:HAD-IIB family hydrolase [Halomonas chromatireducens]AMC99809.1 Putative mannosyl-3-phosphoglycerate phosphatase [Halomonas chromatireducens]
MTMKPLLLDPALQPRLVFTDLDGSLLDHDSFQWQQAKPWLKRLKTLGVPVIPVTCRTRAELLPLREQLGLGDTPFIAENGSVVGLPPAWRHAHLERDSYGSDGSAMRNLGLDIDFIRKRLSVWRERLGGVFRTLGEMTLEEVMALTGVKADEARLARMRQGSEPLLWQSDASSLAAFREALQGDGLNLVQGRRFWHVTGGLDKGGAVTWLVGRFKSLRGCEPLTLGLGDGPSDQSLLEAVDQAVVIRGSDVSTLAPCQPALYRSRSAGPSGWVEGIAYWWGAEGAGAMPKQSLFS